MLALAGLGFVVMLKDPFDSHVGVISGLIFVTGTGSVRFVAVFVSAPFILAYRVTFK